MSSDLPILKQNSLIVSSASMAADITSAYLEISEAKHIGYQASWTGSSPVGSLQMYVSNDLDLNPVAYGSPIAISGNSGSTGLSFENLAFAYVRFVYTKTSGTGNLSIRLSAKR